MLEEVLKLLQEEHTWSIEEMAKQLKTSSDVIKEALEYLKWLGKVERITLTMHCTHNFKGCAGNCNPHVENPIVWRVKSK